MNTEHNSTKSDRWFRDMLVNASTGWGILLVIILILAVTLLPGLWRQQSAGNKEVIVYCAQDQVYAEPILAAFEKETGIKARAVYDSEAVKTVGMANRLLAERDRPQCDVFWGNEELRTRQLAAAGIWRETNGWVAFGYRSRRIVINTNLVPAANIPKSITELTNSYWHGKVALAYPLFGTTATHFLALRQHWGEARWRTWCQALAANKPFLVDGNSVVVKQVGRGEAWIGMTDSDDIAAGQQDGLPVAQLPMTAETLLIPNTVAVVRGAPHPEAAQKLMDYLLQPEAGRALVKAGSLESDDRNPAKELTLNPDWELLLKNLEPATAELKSYFLR